MVEVPKNFTPLTEEKQALSPSLCSKVPSLCQPAELDRSDYSETRLMAASKRSIIKTQNRSFSGGTRTSPTGFLQLSEGGVTPTSSVRSTVDDIKRLRPDSNGTSLRDTLKSRSLRRIRNHSVPTQLESSFSKICASLSSSEVVCKTSLLSKPRLQKLLSMELAYHPNNAFLYYVDPVVEDKVDATLRNEAVHGLRCIHNAFFTLSAETFCKAVNLIDRFVVKVKVKPKYMSCVAAAAYHIAAKLSESTAELGVPNPDTLVQISRCGGSSADLLRLEDIIKTKLGGDLDGVNAYDFLRLFASAAVVFPDSGTFPSPGDQEACTGQAESVEEARPDDGDDDDEVFMANGAVGSCGGGGNKITGQRLLSPISRGCSRSLPDDPHSASSACELTGTLTSTAAPQGRRMYDLWSAMTSRLVVSLCSLEVYRYRPATLALSILLQLRVVGVPGLARLCNVKMDEVRQCGTLVEELYDIYYLDAHPSNRRALVWTLSRRTLCRIGCSSPTPLDTISEDCENDKEDNLQFLFEP